MPLSSTIPRVAAAILSVTCVHVATAQSALPADTAVVGTGAVVLRTSAGIALAAAVAQVSNSPAAWPRTAEGAARRLADQAGFVTLRAVSHRGLSRAIQWTSSTAPCPTGLAGRSWCAVTQTLVAHDRDGAPRPDVARVGSLAIASFASLLWRPERASRGDASVFVLSRVGSGLLFAALRRGLGGRGQTVPE